MVLVSYPTNLSWLLLNLNICVCLCTSLHKLYTCRWHHVFSFEVSKFCLFGLRIQRWFFPYDYQIVQEIHRNDPEVSSRAELTEIGSQLTPDEERSYAISQLPRETSKHTGFAFDSPGYESFFALQAGVLTPQKAWDVARRASMRTQQPRTPQN